MIHKDFQGLSISRLGMGCMRLPTTAPGHGAPIDRPKAVEILEHVYENGVNYFDTAYMYHGGESERILGEVLPRFRRDSYFLADKMPGNMFAQIRKPYRVIFEEQLERTKADHFDFYLLHNLNAETESLYGDEDLGIIPYLLEQKRRGRIRYLGFSNHASTPILTRFLDRFDCFDFVQLHLNYLDWTMQDAQGKYETVQAHGLPVWVMEPVRGGRLASLNPAADAVLQAAAPDRSVSSWAFRWLQSLPGVQIVLSGMTTLDQAKDNLRTFAKPDPLSADEQAALAKAVSLLKEDGMVPCTKCRYCDGCPQDLDIPELLALYNESRLGVSFALMSGLNSVAEGRRPKDCIACGECVPKCPQGIDIPGTFAEFAKKIETLPRFGPPPPPKPATP